jgi:hypothetical protein
MAKSESYQNDLRVGFIDPVTIAFRPHLHKPWAYQGDEDKARYEVQVLIPKGHADVKALKAACLKAAKTEWPDASKATLEKRAYAKFVDGDKEHAAILEQSLEDNPDKPKDYEQLKGKVILKLRSQKPIGCFKLNGGDVDMVQGDEDIQRVFYAGAGVGLVLTGAPTKGSRSVPAIVSLYPEQICFIKDGERFGGGRDNTDGSVFAQVQGQVSDEDPTGEEDDDEIEL